MFVCEQQTGKWAGSGWADVRCLRGSQSDGHNRSGWLTSRWVRGVGVFYTFYISAMVASQPQLRCPEVGAIRCHPTALYMAWGRSERRWNWKPKKGPKNTYQHRSHSGLLQKFEKSKLTRLWVSGKQVSNFLLAWIWLRSTELDVGTWFKSLHVVSLASSKRPRNPLKLNMNSFSFLIRPSSRLIFALKMTFVVPKYRNFNSTSMFTRYKN